MAKGVALRQLVGSRLGTILPSYAEHGRKIRGTVKSIGVETTTVIDLIRSYGVPNRMKVDIEGADILACLTCTTAIFRHIYRSSGRNHSPDQLFALTLLRHMGYARFAFVDQTVEAEQIHATTGLFSNDVPATMGSGFTQARAANVWLHVARAQRAVN
jgi:hypothetical protein